jgi:hypothetical protein
MKNTLTGILLIVFLTVYSVSLNIVNFSFDKQTENDICGLSIGNHFNEFSFNRINHVSSGTKIVALNNGTESLASNIDSFFSGDLFALSQNIFSFGNFTSSQFISRENQIPKEVYMEPVFLPS